MERMRQGLELAQRGAVTLPDDGQALSAVVRSGNNIYQVDMRLLTCTCADYQKHLQACKHLLGAEVHIGALGLIAPVPETSAAADMNTGEEVVTTAAVAEKERVPTTATWPTSEAPASMNVQLKVGNMQLMYTARDTNDRDLQDRMARLLPWLAEVMAACEANYEARQQAARQAGEQAKAAPQPEPERTLDEQIAAAVQAAMRAQAEASINGIRKPPTPPALEPTNDTDPSWCPIHRCKMERRTNERGSWYSHRLSTGAYCKGE